MEYHRYEVRRMEFVANNPLGQIVQLKNTLEKCLLWARNVYRILYFSSHFKEARNMQSTDYWNYLISKTINIKSPLMSLQIGIICRLQLRKHTYSSSKAGFSFQRVSIHS